MIPAFHYTTHDDDALAPAIGMLNAFEIVAAFWLTVYAVVRWLP